MASGERRMTRRALLGRAAAGAGALTLGPGLPAWAGSDEAPGSQGPLAPREPHFPARAKRVIFIFHPGGVSHLETFDPKPALERDHGQAYGNNRYLMRPRFAFAQHGESGAWVSEILPHLAARVDDLAIVRSLRTDHGNHFEATLGMHTGSVNFTRPSIGSWISYGLGTLNPNLPSFVVLAPRLPYAGSQVWAADFLPACHQGVRIVPGDAPIPNLSRRAATARAQELELELLARMNRRHAAGRGDDPELLARARSFATAHALQREAPELFDLSGESDATLELYGLERGANRGFAWQCLMARRLAERGVRFVELIDVGSSGNWDSHGNMDGHRKLARNVDHPIAGLLRDLQGTGLFDETLVVWTTEFGRPPHVKQGEQGRGHHAHAFSSFLAGGGARRGVVHGETDEYGDRIVSGEVHLHDWHATILHLLGLDHERLTYPYSGREFRLTDVHGRVVPELLA